MPSKIQEKRSDLEGTTLAEPDTSDSRGQPSGYAAARYLAVANDVHLLPHVATRVADITGTARVREQGSISATAIGALQRSSPVTVLGFAPTGWCVISTGTLTGFIW